MYADFASLMGQLDHPMCIVTVQGPDGPSGCLVGFATQVSIDPPLFLVGLSKQNHTWRASHAASHLAVQVIPRADGELVRLFGEQTGDKVDKFALCSGDHVGQVLSPVAIGPVAKLSEYVTLNDVKGLTPGHEA